MPVKVSRKRKRRSVCEDKEKGSSVRVCVKCSVEAERYTNVVKCIIWRQSRFPAVVARVHSGFLLTVKVAGRARDVH
jgi:hypothetical protein